jgi:hypothetical protein
MIDLLNRIGFRQIAFGGEGGGGGGAGRNMVTAPKTRLVQKQPHLLAYITPAEASLLKENGGTGEMVDGIPAFRPVKGKTSRGKSSAGTGFSGGSSGGGSSSGGSSNPGDIAGGGYGSGNSGGNAGSSPSYDFGSSNDDNDNDPPPVVYTPPDPVYTYYDPDPTPTPDPVTVSPTDTFNVYDFYDPDPVTVSPTDTSNVYDFYDPDPVTVYDGGSNDEETVMLQPVTYTGPAVETTLDTGDFSLDDLDLGTGVAPVDETSPFVFDAGMLSKVTRGLGTPTTWVGNNTQEASNVDQNNRYDFDYSAAYDPEIIPKTIGALPKEEVVTDGTVVSSVPKPIGPTVTVSTSNASNIAEGRFEGIRDKLEALGYTVSANGSSVYTADGQVAGENWSGSSTISNMLKENQDQNGALASINNKPTATATAPVNTQTFGALPDGVTQQMITDSQNDGEYGYYNNDGSFVPANIDKYNGAGPDYSGVRFASGGGAQFDKDGDRFITKEEIRLGEIEGKGFKDNFWSLTGRGLGGTPLGSGQDPTGVAKWAEKLLVPGGSTIRKLSPPAFERPLSSYDPNNPYADVGENAPNIWWEKGKTNPLGFEYKRTPDEVLADRTASREKAAIAAANEITNNDNDNGPRTRREDLYGTRMTTEEYRRRYKGGGGAALPAYMRKYASGKSIDELVRKVKVNGKDYFLTPDGRYIEPSAFTGAAVARDIDVVETGESEQYLESYNVIDESTGIITTYNTDGSIMEVFDPNFESEEA